MSKKCTLLRREARSQVTITRPGHNLQNTTCPDHFLTLRRRKSARPCGTKHMSESKCQKHRMSGQLLERKEDRKKERKKDR